MHTDNKAFDKERTWNRLVSGAKFGDVLITVSTGKMAEDVAEHVGLVPTHAYAVLDVREVEGKRLLQVNGYPTSTRTHTLTTSLTFFSGTALFNITAVSGASLASAI